MSGRLPGGTAWAVVTGASSGIGEELARGLAARGHALLLVARRAARLEKLADELRAAHGGKVEVRVCDLGDRVGRADLRAELAELEVGVLCANAGFTTCGPLSEADASREREEVEVNAVALHDLVLTVLPGMLARRRGAIVVTGSTAGEQPVPTAATYSATKAFANTFAAALAQELRGTGVTCTLLAPGPVHTEFTAVGGIEGLEAHRWFAWKSAPFVAEAALRGAERGRRVVVPGVMAKGQALAGRQLPRGAVFLLLRTVVLPRLRRARLA
ncbi:SDR family NAD(P)-dependent oxidoreductase [Yinghuangia seranimata]|uniref:SDR family NAD(P)-dependent oxidoreductase n=1 Tax=Yinghuangia seranimata TaxID=408067 RepID=UPI00248B77FA|nr:SDR family oxidoreductase [Yinghuangia seranimata]MDI2127663.1 SDR family oxidoreductase [Yinghuangia seranimata]